MKTVYDLINEIGKQNESAFKKGFFAGFSAYQEEVEKISTALKFYKLENSAYQKFETNDN